MTIPTLKEQIQALPKAELHLHLEGAMPWHLAQQRATQPMPEAEWLADDYKFADFADFGFAVNTHFTGMMAQYDGYFVTAQHLFADLVRQNVRYVEVSFGLFWPYHLGIPYNKFMRLIKDQASPELTVKVYAGINRKRLLDNAYPPNTIEKLFELDELDGIDLHGDERVGGIDEAIAIFEEAHKRGLRTRAHAGELEGAQSIRDTLDKLQVTRLEHGVRAIEDEILMQRLVDDKITLDMAPTSNVRLQVVESLEVYPIKQFLDQGIAVTLNTDDPAIFNCTLNSECLAVVEHCGVTLADLAQMQKNAFAVADISDDMRQDAYQAIDAWLAQAV